MAYSFVRGSGSRIEFPHLTLFDTGSLTWSISYWLRPVASGTAAYDTALDQLAPTGGKGLALNSYSTAQTQLMVSTYGSSTYPLSYMQTTGNRPVVGSWNHCFVMYNGDLADPNRIRMWNNGAEVAWTASQSAAMNTNTGPWRVGNTFNGDLAEVACWSQPIVDTGLVANLRNGRLPTAQTSYLANLVFYAPLVSDAAAVVGSGPGTITGASVAAHPPAVDPQGGAALTVSLYELLQVVNFNG